MTDNLSTRLVDNEREEQGGSPIAYARLLFRWRWLFFAPFFALGLLGFSVAQFLPFQYRSEALIIVEQQKIPEQYVTSNILVTLQRRLDSMTQKILSRTRLQRFIEQFGLYAGEREGRPIDDVIDMMRKRISVDLIQSAGRREDLTGFRIFFSDRDPLMAQRVTSELTSLFIEENVRERTQQSMGTTAFLEGQLEAARKELATEEERVRHYKLKFLGQLPEQQQSNLQILSSLEAQLQASTSALDRAEQQRVYLESMRSQQEAVRNLVKPEESAASPTANTAAGTGSLELAEGTLANLWKQLNEASGKFTDMHPEIIRLRREIAEWEANLQRLRTERTASAELQSRLKATQAEIENEKRDSEELRRRIREVQMRLSQTPVREQELAEITRQYDNTRTHYQSLLQKKLGSELASNLEQSQGGEQFRLMDPASLPKKPEGRQKIVLVSWVLGFFVGAGLVVLREMMDQTVHKEADLEPHAGIPVLVRIPTLRTAGEIGRQRNLRVAEVVAVAIMTLVSLATGAHTYLKG